ncbi:MAG: sodium:solute symporter family protein [Actinobacteria bacterium]|nr:sodium:solute symporter family protein [Actinomycetota bacterium]
MAAIVFGAIIILSLLVAFMAHRGRDVLQIEEYLVGGRSFSGVLLFFLAVGEIYSIGTMVGLPGGIYAEGASYGIWFLGYILLAYPVGYFLGPLMWRAGKRYGAMTVPDVFKGHYGSRLLEVVAALSAIVFLVPWGQLQFTGLQVALGALGFSISPTTAVVVAAMIAFAYIVVSGVRAPANVSILKDVLLFAAIVIAGIAAASAAGGVSNVFEDAQNLNPSSLSIEGQALTFALTTIVFQALGFYVTPLTVPFLFTGRSEVTVRRTLIPMPLYMLMYPFLIIAAYYAISASQGLEQPNAAFFVTAVEVLPPWLLGLVAGAAALSGLLILAGLSLVVGAMVSRNLAPNLPGATQRRLVQVIVAVYLIVSAGLTILAPTLMLALISTAYYGFTQFLPAFVGVFLVRRFSALGIAAGLVCGDVAVLVLYGLGVSTAGINIGLIALLLNFVVTFAVSTVAKNESSLAPIAASGRPATRQAEGSAS